VAYKPTTATGLPTKQHIYFSSYPFRQINRFFELELKKKLYLCAQMTITVKQIALIYLVAINVVTFFLYGIDKRKAKRGKWRIPEATLLGLAVIGGSIGAWLGMRAWHHKTMHKKFKYGIPLILIAQIALAFWILTSSLD
jgi:uncharacterized membrane protein YsdA (DUF1294 family)